LILDIDQHALAHFLQLHKHFDLFKHCSDKVAQKYNESFFSVTETQQVSGLFFIEVSKKWNIRRDKKN